ncbi:MAG: type II toxin-antitoxin system RelE/ParE family toxin [Bacteroidota bacterium]
MAGNYRIIYRLQDNKNCIVLAVVHGARQIEKVIGE